VHVANLLSLHHNMGLRKNRHVRCITWLVFYHIAPSMIVRRKSLIKELNKSSLERIEHEQKQWSWYALYPTNRSFQLSNPSTAMTLNFCPVVRILGKRLQLQESLLLLGAFLNSRKSRFLAEVFNFRICIYFITLIDIHKGIWANVPQFSKRAAENVLKWYIGKCGVSVDSNAHKISHDMWLPKQEKKNEGTR
jgi:hypothetical protein